jgi:metallo-beta-lactamase family protein
VDGAKAITLLGRSLAIAARIEKIDSMSAHADANEIMQWLSGFVRPPRRTFLVHGEPAGLNALAARIAAERGWPVHIPAYGERVNLEIST